MGRKTRSWTGREPQGCQTEQEFELTVVLQCNESFYIRGRYKGGGVCVTIFTHIYPIDSLLLYYSLKPKRTILPLRTLEVLQNITSSYSSAEISHSPPLFFTLEQLKCGSTLPLGERLKFETGIGFIQSGSPWHCTSSTWITVPWLQERTCLSPTGLSLASPVCKPTANCCKGELQDAAGCPSPSLKEQRLHYRNSMPPEILILPHCHPARSGICSLQSWAGGGANQLTQQHSPADRWLPTENLLWVYRCWDKYCLPLLHV